MKQKHLFHFRGAVPVFLGLLLSAAFGFLLAIPVLAQNPGQALADAKQAVAKGDTRFVSVLGCTTEIPAIRGGIANGLVLVHKYKEPIGIGDYLRNSNEIRQQEEAVKYAQIYNSFLLEYLLKTPDQKTRLYLQQVRQEMEKFQKSNPKADALRSFQSEPVFLMVTGSMDGYPDEDSRVYSVDQKRLLMNASVLRGSELQRFNKIVNSYVIPYNRTLYKLLVRKWKKQGLKNRLAS